MNRKIRAAALATAVALGLSLILTSACSVNVAPPKAAASGADPQKAWANVLSKYVDENGKIDFLGMSKDRADLDTFVAWMASTSPTTRQSLTFSSRWKIGCRVDKATSWQVSFQETERNLP